MKSLFKTGPTGPRKKPSEGCRKTTLMVLGKVDELRLEIHNKADLLRRSAHDPQAVLRISKELKDMVK